MYLHEKLGVFYDEDNSTRQNFKADIIQDLQEETFSNFAHLGIYIYIKVLDIGVWWIIPI